MPIYFFNIRDGQPILKDNVGVDLPHLDAAIDEGRREGDLVVGALLGTPELLHGLQVHIMDEDGNILKKLDLPDAKEFAR
jgi:hypothetical protein